MKVKTASSLSQIVPLSDQKPRQRDKLKRPTPSRQTTHDRLVEALCENDRLQRELEIVEGERNRAREETKASKRQLIDICQFKDSGGAWVIDFQSLQTP